MEKQVKYTDFWDPAKIKRRIIAMQEQANKITKEHPHYKPTDILFILSAKGKNQVEDIISDYRLRKFATPFEDRFKTIELGFPVYNPQVWDAVIQPFFVMLIDQIHTEFDSILDKGRFLFVDFDHETKDYCIFISKN